ncbi:MAG TPA: DNA polymerase III subunit alpha [Gemmatimonadaceae bacterium]|nr:DNA polymerase III subunit alpha [Gemmatimonadaceae bacterium]
MSFVHLHCHSEYSLLDGANRIDDLIARALEFEQPALAITDHGNLHGAWEFQEKAKKAGLKPIIGMEAYVAPGDRRARDRVGGERGKPYYHLVLLAQNAAGYRNLVKLSSLAYTEGFYAKPRMDRELLAKYNEGIVVSSACMAGEIAHHLLSEEYDQARETAAWYADVFRDRYYLEVQAHSSDNQDTLNRRIFQLAEEVGVPVLATNDAHFLKREDHDAHDVLLCIGLGKDFSDTNRMRYDEGLYFKSAPEIASAFPGRADVLENTLRIADESAIQFSKQYKVPSFPLPEGIETENELLVRLAEEGSRKRYGEILAPEVRERLDYELGVITSTGYAGYFLIVADFIDAARKKGIPVGPGRGSVAGSLVAYALHITDVCPLRFDLLFERFLNPERVSMPDIDVDFCFERRGEVIEYVRQKYGRDSVGQIITFGTLKSRAAIKDVGRTLGFSPSETDYLAKLIPNHPNFSLTVSEAIERIPEVRELYTARKDDPRELREKKDRYRTLLDYAMKLEGLSRHAGVHAAGVVIAPGPLDEYVPVCTQASKGSGAGNVQGEEAIVVTQYDMNALEKVGMLKMDFLGLTTLTVISDTVHGIRERTGSAPDLDSLPLDDVDTYRMLRAGKTAGVFQFESALATDMLKNIRADRFDDLVASNALMRPGPLDAGMHKVYMRRKRGEEPVSYILPELQPILQSTYGVITYQEQVMRIAQAVAGISLAEADVLRKAVGKKDSELIREELGKFVTKSIDRGYDATIINEIASQIETFGRYGFNKSHSVAYSIISYHTAWLKTHFPADFMAALLSSQIGDTDNVVKYINEARQLHVPGAKEPGLQILPPDVNESGYKFTVVGATKIRFGLGAVRNVGRTAIDSIIGARKKDGPFRSIFDLCERIDLRICNKRVLEALAHAGALDSLGGHRAQLAAGLDLAIREASLKQEEIATGQASLFAVPSNGTQQAQADLALPNVQPWTESERLSKEKEILGFYISGHPLERFRAEAEIYATHTVADLGAWRPENIALSVVVTNIKKQLSKKSGKEFARLTIEDFSGSGEVLVFPEKWEILSDKIRTDVPMLVKGAYSKRDEGGDNPAFIIDSAEKLIELRSNGELTIAIELSKGSYTHDVMSDVRAIAETFPGSAPLEFRWSDGSGSQARLRSRSLTVAADGAALTALRNILGESSVRLEKGS